MAKSPAPRSKVTQRPESVAVPSRSQDGEGLLNSVLVAMASVIASLIALVSALVAAGATQAAAIVAVAIIATIVGAFAVAGIYMWHH